MSRPKRWGLIGSGLALLLIVSLWALRGPTPVEQIQGVLRDARALSAWKLSAGPTPSLPAALSGRVHDLSGRPIGGARVCSAHVNQRPLGEDVNACAETDVGGTYVLSDVAPGLYLVHAAAAGFLAGTAEQGRPLLLAPNQRRDAVDIVLRPGGVEITGQVSDATGGPVAHASVRVARTPAGEVFEVVTDGDGHFAAALAPGSVALTARASGYAPTFAFATVPQRGVSLVLTPASTIRGRVLAAADRSPVAGVRVRAVAIDREAAPIHHTGLSDEAGAFVLSDLSTGNYGLIAQGEGWYGESEHTTEIGLGESASDVEILVGAAPPVRGRVVLGSTAEPCTRGEVRLTSVAPVRGRLLQTTIAADGAAMFDAVPPGRYRAFVHCSDHIPLSSPDLVEVASDPVEEVVWRVQRGAGMAIQIVDGADRLVPRARFQIRFTPVQGAIGLMPLVADAEGRYETPTNFQPGSYTLEPIPVSAGPAVHVELREGGGKLPVTLRLAGRGSILVVARSSTGDAIDGLEVTAERISDPAPVESGQVAADLQPTAASTAAAPEPLAGTPLGDGRHQVGPLEAGRYRVRVRDGINAEADVQGSDDPVVTVRDGEVVTRVVLARDGSIQGRVVDEAGEPVPNVWVRAQHQSTSDAADARPSLPAGATPLGAMLTDLNGRFTLDGLVHDQTYVVRAEQPYGAASTRRDVRPGDDLTLVFPALGTLRGTAVDRQGAPVARFSIHATHSATDTTRSSFVTTRDGRWELDRTMPGELQVLAVDEQGRTARQPLELDPGRTSADVKLVFESEAPLAIHQPPEPR